MQGFCSLKVYQLMTAMGAGEYLKNRVDGLLPGEKPLGPLQKSLE